MGLVISCRKVHYASRSDAVFAIERMIVLGIDSNPRFRIRPYLCDQCHAWHVGHDKSELFDSTD